MDEIFRKLGININFSFVLIYGSLIWVRCLAVVSVIPFLFAKPVPRQIRVGGAFVLAIFLYPNLVPVEPVTIPEDQLVLAVLYLKEIFFGLSIGMAVSVLFYAFDAAGRLIDNQRGMGIARVLIPALGEQGSITGNYLFQFAIVIFLIIGGHRLFLTALFDSFVMLPVLEVPVIHGNMMPLMELFMVATGKVIYIALQVSAPVMIAIFLSDMIMGIANRIAPQINVWMLSFTLRGYVGTLMLFLALTLIIGRIEYYTLYGNKYSRQVLHIIKYGETEMLESPMPEIDEDLKDIPRLKIISPLKDQTEE